MTVKSRLEDLILTDETYLKLSPYPRKRFARVVRRICGSLSSNSHPCLLQKETASSAVPNPRLCLPTISWASAVEVHPIRGFSHLQMSNPMTTVSRLARQASLEELTVQELYM